MTDNPRKIALNILNELDKKYKTLDSILENISEKNSLISKRDRSLLSALVFGVLRWRGRLDYIIGYFSRTPLDKIDPGLLNIFRLGLFQIIYMDRIPVSAAVNTSVEMAKQYSDPWIVRFANGLLRNAARKYETVCFPNVNKYPADSLAAEKSFPKWLIKRWLNRFGLKETGMLCDAVNMIPKITLRTNTLATGRKQLAKAIEPFAEDIELTDYSSDGILFSRPKTPIPEMKPFKKGWFQVQDEAAQLISCLLNPQPGQTVLDACAGLGGKTGHIAHIMKNQGRIAAMDKDERKLLQLKSEMDRIGVSIVTLWQHNLNKSLKNNLQSSILNLKSFDRVLVDAPCSGIGVIRRNPDTKWFKTEEDLPWYKERQIKFMDNVASLVKSGGLLVYAVCSTEPEENEEVAEAFLGNHPEFVLEKDFSGLPEKALSIVNQDGYLKTFPHINNMDGFFAACFKRN
ncbi:MAG: 16S rRNA (cytosine(967)-C(5))-methyltransferase RsmB [Desulfobacterales bacterium]|nr:16S rRNA (cytosine(967)-C(5))-methyltransferase RsmB [Desulfobacterales bacterium]